LTEEIDSPYKPTSRDPVYLTQYQNVCKFM